MRHYFQWLVGDDRGKVVELADITQEDGEFFYNFIDGESCNLSYICPATSDKKQLRGKAMVEVPGPYNCWKFEEIKMGSFTTAEHEQVDVPPLEDIIGMNGDNSLDHSALGTMNLIPPKPNPIKGMPLPDIQEYLREEPKNNKPKSSGVTTAVQTESVEKKEETVSSAPVKEEPRVFIPQNKQNVSDPVHILVNTCKKHVSTVDLKMELSLPSVSTYNFAKSEFENGDEKFIDAITDSIPMDTIIKAVRDSLREAYESTKSDA